MKWPDSPTWASVRLNQTARPSGYAITPITKKKAGASRSAETTSRLGRITHEIPRSSAFDGAGGHAGDEVVDEEGIQHGDRNGAQKRSSHQFAPKELVTVDEFLRNADRDGLDQAVIQEDQRVEEFVPREGEGKERGGQYARDRQRDRDPQHCLDTGCAIDQGRFLQLARYAFEEAHEHPGAERDQEGGIREDQRPQVVEEMQLSDDESQRQEEKRGRYQIGHENSPADGVGAAVAQARQRVACENAAEERDQGADDRHHRRVERPVRKVRLGEQVLVPGKGRIPDP